MMIKEIGRWNCALDGIKSGKPVCPECGTEIAHYCGAYSHEKVFVSERKQSICQTICSE